MSDASQLVIICIILGIIIFCGLPVLLPVYWQKKREREPAGEHAINEANDIVYGVADGEIERDLKFIRGMPHDTEESEE